MLFYALHAGRRRVVRRNITRCFPGLTPVEHARLIRAHYRAAGQATLDEPVAWFSSAARLRRLVRFRGREHYDGALAAGRNIILLAPHFVGLGMGGFRLSMERPMVSVYRNPKNELLDAGAAGAQRSATLLPARPGRGATQLGIRTIFWNTGCDLCSVAAPC